MATGLIALLDDVAAIAKLAAASLDDVAAQTAKASVKAAGVVIDDTAVTPSYVIGLSPSRELPIIGRIAFGSLRNKILFLLPICLLLGYFASWLIMPLLMIGGLYLCYEGAEKVHEAFFGHHGGHSAQVPVGDAGAIEEQKVSGAIRTDFILSAEIMALTLSGIATSSVTTQAAVLAGVGIIITVAVYGVVALIVKADDIGLYLVRSGGRLAHVIGHALVKGVPVLLKLLAVIGTAAMLWVGGSIVVHGLAELGLHQPEHVVDYVVHAAEAGLSALSHAGGWLAGTLLQAIFGLLLGGLTMAIAKPIRLALGR